MIKNFEVILGIEVHVALLTDSKMFSPAPNQHNATPNTLINEIDLGLPGIMPSPNLAAVKKAMLLAKAFDMKIENKLSFDRKNYFYMDLPKGFQITQQFRPIGKDGKIEIADSKNNKFSFELERIHIEEDTAKQNNQNESGDIFLDYNRAGVPLIEIVSKPLSCSPEIITLWLKYLRKVLIFNNISDAKMEDGSMRVDVNISLRPYGAKKYGTKVEIKNINSISNVDKAIQFEIKRQSSLLLKDEPVLQETRRFNDKTNETEFMRLKTDAVEYRYMNEPNIFFKKITKEFIDETLLDYFDVKSFEEKLSHVLSNEFVNLILDNKTNYHYFQFVNELVNDEVEVAKWLFVELYGLISRGDVDSNNVNDRTLKELASMINDLKKQSINGKQAKEILKHIFTSDLSCAEIIEKYNFKQITDENEIKQIFSKIIETNREMLEQYESRPERVEKFFLGLIMKETNGQINPQKAIDVFRTLIS